jgi:hypothetical protein
MSTVASPDTETGMQLEELPRERREALMKRLLLMVERLERWQGREKDAESADIGSDRLGGETARHRLQ